MKDKGITISKEDHVVINLASDSDSSVGGDNHDGQNTSNSPTNDQPSCSNETTGGNIATIEVENIRSTSSGLSSESNTLESQKSSGSSEVYVKNTQASIHTQNNNDDNGSIVCGSSPDTTGQEDHVMATRIEIRLGEGADNVAFQNSKTDPV